MRGHLVEGQKYKLGNPGSDRNGEELMVVAIKERVITIFWFKDESVSKHALAIADLLWPIDSKKEAK